MCYNQSVWFTASNWDHLSSGASSVRCKCQLGAAQAGIPVYAAELPEKTISTMKFKGVFEDFLQIHSTFRLISPPFYNLTRLSAFPFDLGWRGASWHLGPWHREEPGGVRRSSRVPTGPPQLAYWERTGETRQDRLPRRPFCDYRTTLCFRSKGLVRLKCGMRRKRIDIGRHSWGILNMGYNSIFTPF